ncbi:hypothetical protein [Kitasatospora sp. NPDC048407]|uniref:hypothetical protein n=1 Tax=Kitasatospora sp. NPDC048407 TaxID=3364051 RepID=UPI0037111DBC
MENNTGMNTYQRLVVRLHELGMIDRRTADEQVASTAAWGEPRPERRAQELAGVLDECGVAVRAHGEDVDFAESAYESVLRNAARIIGGAVTVTGVELVGEIGDTRELRFKVNGVAKSWWIDQPSDDYLDLGAIELGIGDLEPGGADPRVFHPVPADETCGDDLHLLATPAQAAALREEFGLRIRVCDADGAVVQEV